MKPQFLLAFPFVLVALCLVVLLLLGLTPFACLYFCFSRFCAAIEYFKPRTKSSRKQGTRQAKRLKVPPHLFNLIPRFNGQNPIDAGQSETTSPAL